MVTVWMYVLGSFAMLVTGLPYPIQVLLSLIAPMSFQLSLASSLRQSLILSRGYSPSDVAGLGYYPTVTGVIMLVFDGFLYLALTWYISNVFPGDGTAGLKPWFLFTKDYWRPNPGTNCSKSSFQIGPTLT